jgi:hypothetical protein
VSPSVTQNRATPSIEALGVFPFLQFDGEFILRNWAEREVEEVGELQM